MSETSTPAAGRHQGPALRSALRAALCLALLGAGALGPALAEESPQQPQPAQAPQTGLVPDSFPFRLSAVKEAAIGAGGLGIYGSSLYLEARKPSPRASDINASDIPFFDRLYVTSHPAWMGTAADALMVTAAVVPELAAAAFVPDFSLGKFATIGVMYAETMGLAYATPNLLKAAITRYRPYAYASTVDLTDSELNSSFPSRHAVIAFSSAVFAGYVFDELAPDSPWRTLVWVSGLGLATATSALRVASGDHFLSDVVAGGVFGAAIGFAVPWMHRTRSTGEGLSLAPLPGGLLVSIGL
ncbi:MAG TPA: phosphatase PAP2 family protein [Rectinemataceae bacterium]|nr:phosphatase PAP2 family protein [Rectinemataceae bacterium]